MSVTPKPVVYDSGVAYAGDVLIKNWVRAKVIMEQARRDYNERCNEAHRNAAEFVADAFDEIRALIQAEAK